MNNKVYKISLTTFYLLIIIFSILNFISDDFSKGYVTNTFKYIKVIDIIVFAISGFYSIFSIYFVLKDKCMSKENKFLWCFISLFFPFLLIYFVWKIMPPNSSDLQSEREK